MPFQLLCKLGIYICVGVYSLHSVRRQRYNILLKHKCKKQIIYIFNNQQRDTEGVLPPLRESKLTQRHRDTEKKVTEERKTLCLCASVFQSLKPPRNKQEGYLVTDCWVGQFPPVPGADTPGGLHPRLCWGLTPPSVLCHPFADQN